MVNGKPNLTFGDNHYTQTTRLQARNNRAQARKANKGADFESYLPLADFAPQKGPQTNGALRQNQRQAGMAQAPLDRSRAQSAVGFTPLALTSHPAINASGGVRDGALAGADPSLHQARARRSQDLLPPGRNSRNAARADARDSMQAWNANREFASQASQLSQKRAPRLSQRPITGRPSFGMVDTRKNPGNPADGDALSRGAKTAQNRGARGAADNFYAGRAGQKGMGTFANRGFGGGNADAALRSIGYNVDERQPENSYARRLDSDRTVTVPNSDARGLRYGSALPVGVGDEGRPPLSLSPLASDAAKRVQRGALTPSGYPARSLAGMAKTDLGSLAAKFESGSDGIAAIGYDRKGGTSYGKFQISSRAGTMGEFLKYLDKNAPEVAKRLRAAGPANTGGRYGKMPGEWKEIAAADPQRFEQLQEDFIRTSHFEPALQRITQSTGIGFNDMPAALREVLFSTAVQHGPFGAVRIFNQALNSVGVNKLQGAGKKLTESFKQAGRQLIKQVYALRAGQFMSSTSGVRAAVKNRLSQEMNEALEMLA